MMKMCCSEEMPRAAFILKRGPDAVGVATRSKDAWEDDVYTWRLNKAQRKI